ncbi:MAG: hypothetical protein NC548_33515 [Lachnospiraceae bacterium]|nr:hypothetical protein [Lachnospiraceae bacterium]
MRLRIALTYLILLVYSVINGFRGGVVYFLFPIVLLLLSWLNFYRCAQWRTVLILHIHLLAASVLGISLAYFLFCTYVSDDAETHMLFMLMYMVGVAMVVGLGAITTGIRYFSAKK